MTDSDEIERLRSLLRSSRDREARPLCEKLVEQGHPELAVHLGWMYETGRECVRDPDLARKYYQLSASSGDVMGQYYLGRFLLRSNEVKEGIRWLELSASEKYAPSLYRMGLLYRQGRFVPRDPQRARALLEAAASRGHFFARREIISSALRFHEGILPALMSVPRLVKLMLDALSVARRNPFDDRFIT